MSENQGKIGWIEFHVNGSIAAQNFYSQVVGWQTEGLDVEGKMDYNVFPKGSEEAVAGIIHSPVIAAQKAMWVPYLVVDDVNFAAGTVKRLGGQVIEGPKDAEGYGKYCLIQDPFGAICALFEPS
ncbi:MAG: hypothetical protein KF784_03730 [Fimbriimonadaceae bacterium]|nr:hypothetical protein [Fimbriimonadaceae bacterium]